jgi:hypothetical protein
MSYGWLITKDHLPDVGRNATGVMGPRGILPKIAARLEQGEGIPFRMYDDDDELYFEGRLIGGSGLEPLDDYGTGDSGCTRIDLFANGKWSTV